MGSWGEIVSDFPQNELNAINVSSVTIINVAGLVVGSGKEAEVRQLSAMYVETVEKKPGLSKAKSFQGDASKVIIQGTGLKKGFVGRAGTFTLDVKDAGQQLCTLKKRST